MLTKKTVNPRKITKPLRLPRLKSRGLFWALGDPGKIHTNHYINVVDFSRGLTKIASPDSHDNYFSPQTKKLFLILSAFLFLILITKTVSAHCPLCTVGAGAAAAGAAWIGVSKVVIGLFIGAFAMSMGMWFSRIPKKQFLPFQKTLIVTAIFLTTVIPLLPIFTAIGPLYLPFIGAYGTTFALNYSLVSSLFGGFTVFVSPVLSRRITKLRKGKIIPFQGTVLTLLSLILAGLVIQLLV